MVISTNCKINLSLSVLKRRIDGFSEIETVLFPINGELCDIVELIRGEELKFSSSGIKVNCNDSDNLCVKAFSLMQQRFELPPVKIHLHKTIPFGAGLGAGSANAVGVLKMCNDVFSLKLTDEQLEEIAGELGSDTAFFVKNRSAIARGRGEILTPIEINLSGYYILLVKPNVGVSTADAYRAVTPQIPQILPSEAIKKPIEEWYSILKNDFETPIFRQLPALEIIKQEMYRAGAIYASMSGSGSTIYAIFKERPELKFPHFSYLHRVD